MKKNRLILSGLAVALLGASAAFAAPHMGGFGPRPHGGPGMAAHSHEKREMKRIPDGAPEEIKAAYKEMRSLRRDLNLELRKDSPDAAKAMEMLKKSEELHMKVREWEVKQILEGNAPKPRAPRPGFDPKGRRPGFGPAPFGRPQGGSFVPPPMMWWTPYGFQMMPMPRPGFGPKPHCHCGMNGHGPHGPAAEAPEQVPAPEKSEDAKL